MTMDEEARALVRRLADAIKHLAWPQGTLEEHARLASGESDPHGTVGRFRSLHTAAHDALASAQAPASPESEPTPDVA